jgi:beta-exotoxin I transport system permease protein
LAADVARLDLRLRRRSTAAYGIGFALYAVLIVVLYPTFEHDTSLNDLTSGNATLSALFGATGSLTSPDGWMNANLYANFVPLFALFMTIGYGAAAIGGQDEDGTLGAVASLPIGRPQLLAEKMLALGALALPIPVITLASALVGRRFDVDLGVRPLIGVTLGASLMALDFGLLALALGAWTGRRGTALGVSVAIAAASYVVSALSPVVDWVHAVRFSSLFYWSVGGDQLRDGLGLGATVLLAAVGASLAGAAAAGFRRLDIH